VAGRTASFGLPPAAVRLLMDLLGQPAAGHAVSVDPTHTEAAPVAMAGAAA